ncbi:28 kDa ribonucleoprotein, chloroplastic isoform X1 [Amborella trichopoda]|uniref:28 kDa ribonucleoprotein, chloroplastic isoform X1 n=1 Tax=Amborella trichopoda TaxID=13333 RepID=UPI0005D4535B|nr:28 kDa ribonucleoprotein, chloroplastic isoform X1 [Amborella trichopoda]|eukprot:XP_011621272.1 28 kDa ribonucleoprotein, chloroplastic isoform X1 [Amborella trichopoda]
MAMSPSCFPFPSTKSFAKLITPSVTINTFRSPHFTFPSSFLCSLPYPLSISYSPHLFSHLSHEECRGNRVFRVAAVAEEEASPIVEEVIDENGENHSPKYEVRPCKLYACNLPRSCDIAQLSEIFQPFGTVLAVEVSRNKETGESRGCGYVTMNSLAEAKSTIASLDGSVCSASQNICFDLRGREMCIRFAADMSSTNRNQEAFTSMTKKNLVFESPHKLYIGNVPWAVKPEDVREHFTQFGNVVSARLLYDRKAGRNRVYGFVSFSSETELEAALSFDGKEFHGRTMLVRLVNRRSEP